MAFGLLGQLIGVLLILFGGFLIVIFPAYSTDERAPGHQPVSFTISAIFIGILCLFIGALLIFF